MQGDQISHYRLAEKLGAGTYGVVYEASHIHDPELRVAVKVVHSTLANDEQFVAALRRECRVLASLTHPGIVGFRDLVLNDGHAPAMVLELLEGRDLFAQIHRGTPLSIDRVVQITEHVMSALAHAHERGIVHRDIKPSNMFLCANGDTKLLDFGVARAADDSRATKTGQLTGTLDYIPAEVWHGARASAAADVYAVGLVVWEMLVGRPACIDGSLANKMGWHLTGTLADPRTQRADCPAWLADVVARFTHRDIATRPENGQAALRVLQQAREQSATSQSPTARAPAPTPAPQTVSLDHASLPTPAGSAEPGSLPPETVSLEGVPLPSAEVPPSQSAAPVGTPREESPQSSKRGLILSVAAACVLGIAVLGLVWVGDGSDEDTMVDAASVPDAVAEPLPPPFPPPRSVTISRLEAKLASAEESERFAMLAELQQLYWEEGDEVRTAEERTLREAQLSCLNRAGQAASLEQCPRGESTNAGRKWFDKVVQTGLKLLEAEGASSHPDLDMVVFYTAEGQWAIGERAAAADRFKDILRTYPRSPVVTRAYVRLGDFYFDRNDATKALFAYQRAAQDRKDSEWPYAAYRQAWCLYNVGESAKAIDVMKSVMTVAAAEPNEGALEAGASRLRERVLRHSDVAHVTLSEEVAPDLVRFFVDAGQTDEALKYFNGLDRPELFVSAMEHMAKVLRETGRLSRAAETYQRLVAMNREHRDAPKWLASAIDVFSLMGRDADRDKNRELFDVMFADDSVWMQANLADADALAAAMALRERLGSAPSP